MREIKFRGQRVDTKEFIYGSLIYYETTDEYFICFKKLGFSEGEYPNEYIMQVEVISESVGQFTGKKDKEQKEIYEGDIIIWETDTFDNGTKGEVLFEDGKWVIYDKINYFDLYNQLDIIKVIGNKYQNPELTK